jgi:Flp pilus assembly pilin Flp
MSKFINQFLKDEDGAVTVDWVVLTAAIVGLGVAGISSVQSGVVGLAGKIGTAVDADTWVGAGVGE